MCRRPHEEVFTAKQTLMREPCSDFSLVGGGELRLQDQLSKIGFGEIPRSSSSVAFVDRVLLVSFTNGREAISSPPTTPRQVAPPPYLGEDGGSGSSATQGAAAAVWPTAAGDKRFATPSVQEYIAPGHTVVGGAAPGLADGTYFFTNDFLFTADQLDRQKEGLLVCA